MLKTIKAHKEELQFIALYVGAALAGAAIAYTVISLKHAPALKMKDIYEEMLSNKYLDDIRKYGITETIDTPVPLGTPVYSFSMK